MKSNSNFNITKVTVDPISQEITELEINGKPFESGGEANLEERVYDSDNKLSVFDLFGPKTGPVHIYPSVGYDGLNSVTIEPGGLTGYPTGPEHLYIKTFVECDSEGETVPGGQEYEGTLIDVEQVEEEANTIYINNTKISFTSKEIVVPGPKETRYYIYYWPYESQWIKIAV